MVGQARGTLQRNVRQHKAALLKATNEILEDRVDRLNCLPDSLLLHILSFLEMPDVINTTLLSTRWRYLWTSISSLNFSGSALEDDVTFIDRSLYHYEGSKVDKLLIHFIYINNTNDLQVDSWIRFARRHNVEEFVLDFFHGMYPDDWSDKHYKLPRSLFNFKSLTSLTLSFCILNLPDSIDLSSLKTLSLQFIDISSDMITHLTSSCPLLEDLYFEGCNRHDHLNITITSQNLKSLRIYDFNGDISGSISICAPNLLSLKCNSSLPREKYIVHSLPSLVTAEFYDCGNYDSKEFEVGGGYVWARLLGDLHHVKKLVLCRYFIQVLSIWEVQMLDSFPTNAKHIELQTFLSKRELPGIFYILKNSSKLESLTIRRLRLGNNIQCCRQIADKFDFKEAEFWESKGSDSPSLLQNLKTVKVGIVSMEFVKFLLRSSKALERMVIDVGKNKASGNNYKRLFELAEKLLALPRASPNAEICII
ncbi:hypothetical protein AQUCO_00900662v1 [Aquilegia coerulea]|uniref:F-box domain-containing protein n=1 Tax=Aquilegia coerulea TaxID=218851 RepID=A0A2G5EES9_AQUCA|nr:hypothetical protein AQUCO_00900662v1 [Aquilegia coerulea]